MLTPKNTTRGYYQVCLVSEDGRKTYRSVHRLVCEAFVDRKSDDQIFVNHINGNKKDNRVKNLEWVTPSENNKHAMRLGLSDNSIRALNKASADKSIKVAGYDEQGKEVVRFNSTKEAYRAGYTQVSRAINGKIEFCRGLRWERVN